MLTPLAHLEAKIEQLLESHFVKLWQTQFDPHTVASQLAIALEAGASAKPTHRARPAAPTAYEVRMHPLDAASLSQRAPHFTDLMADQLLQIARELNFLLLDTPTVTIVPDHRVPKNQPRITTEMSPEDPEATRQLTPLSTPQQENGPSTLHTYLIVDGRHEVPLQKLILTLGRGLENDIIIEQPGVSRHHAQLRRRQRRWVLFDLNSTSGTFLNGDRISEAALQTGDVITLATSKLIFAEEHSNSGIHPDRQQSHDQTVPLRLRSSNR